MLTIKKDDNVAVIAGRDKGKKGKVISPQERVTLAVHKALGTEPKKKTSPAADNDNVALRVQPERADPLHVLDLKPCDRHRLVVLLSHVSLPSVG